MDKSTKEHPSYSPDILAKGLDVVFCGINPAISAVSNGHNFSNPSNRFWQVLHLSRFTPIRIQPQDERQLLHHKCGITAVVERPTKSATEISANEFKIAKPIFEAKVRNFAPRSLAFLGKRAFSSMIAEPNVAWGLQPIKIMGVAVWVLPNPSGRNRSYSLDLLVQAYAKLHTVLNQVVSP